MDRDRKQEIMILQKGLILLLEQMSSLQQELLALEEEKKDVLVKGNMERLSEMVERENHKISLLGKLERERGKVAGELAKEWRLAEESLTIEEMIRRADDPFIQSRLRELKEQLIEENDALQRMNEINSMLIHESLEYVKMNYALLTGQEENKLYTNQIPAEEGDPPFSRSFFDTRL